MLTYNLGNEHAGKKSGNGKNVRKIRSLVQGVQNILPDKRPQRIHLPMVPEGGERKLSGY